ncbi:MAG: primosomal protein N' [Sedimentisphaerales bacterium]|nr:primosomal protein N' [Sedimentisphaerales bacterium]
MMNRYGTDSLFEKIDDMRPASCKHIICVAFETAADTEFDYGVPDEIWPIQIGQRVEAPLGKNNKLHQGFGVEIRPPEYNEKLKFKLKAITKVIDKEPLVDFELMELARWISTYYVCPLGQVLAAIVPSAVKHGAGVKTQNSVFLNVKAENFEKKISKLKGKKQKQIVTILQEQKAFDKDSAIELQSLLEKACCSKEPLKKLAEEQIIKTVQKTVLKSLPAIPLSLSKQIPRQIVLNHDQQNALESIKTQIASGEFGVTLVYGVTDSGKTELYIRSIQAVLEKGRSAIVLLPEIALTTQTVQRFNERFERIAVMHSGLTAAQRNVQWQKIKSGEADVVIGARSAVFAPLKNLGLIVVDEEHEPSYKQDTVPRYHGRDVAIKRAQLANAHCILGSATPSLETLANCQNKKHFNLVRLPKRVMDLPMPEMKLIDMRQSEFTQRGINLISEPLAERLKLVLERKEQAILLLNRRGYSSFVFCPSCKYTLHCRNCDVTLTFHKSQSPRQDKMNTITGKHISHGYAICHYCLAQTLVPEKCPVCGKGFAMIGLGSQRLEEELAGRFHSARVSRMDSDSMSGKDYYHLLKDFGEGKIDILAGTQMLAKGLHFPNVTLVGIISADTCLYLPDFRANERTFQLISQVAGRTGRSEKKGIVFVQTFLPDQQAIQYAIKADFDGFIKEELTHRKSCNLPPYWRLASIVLRDMEFEKLETACNIMKNTIDQIVRRENLNIKIRGPMPAIINRIQRFHRMQIIVQAPDAATMQRFFAKLREEKPARPAIKTTIDIDPVNLL